MPCAHRRALKSDAHLYFFAMVVSKRPSRSILKRRGSISTAVQGALNLAAVMGLAVLLVRQQIGGLTAEYSVLLLLLGMAMVFAYDQYGVYRSNSSFARKALTLFKAWSLAFGFLLVVGFATKQTEGFSRMLLGQLYGAGYLLQVLLQYLSREVQTRVMHHAVTPENALIVGTGKLARYLQNKISGNPWLNQKVVGCLELPSAALGRAGTVGSHLYETSDFGTLKEPNIIGPLDEMLNIIDRHDVRTIYFAIPLGESNLIEDMYFQLLDRNVAVHWVPDIFSLLLVNHSVREMAGLPVLTLSETPLTGTRLLLKAVEDIVLACLILLLISPLLLLIAAAIKLDSPGPVFFRQARKGWSGKIFHIWKFRSMFTHQPESGKVQQATRNDPRVTRVGAFLRKTSLDELPQVFNVLMGERCRWWAPDRTRCSTTQSTPSASTPTSPVTTSSRASPAWLKCVACAAKPPRSNACSSASNRTLSTSTTGRSGSTCPSCCAPWARSQAKMPTEIARPFPGVETHWTYVPSRPRWDIVWRRWPARMARQDAPEWKLLTPPATTGRWLLYFMFLPHGQLSPQHRFTLERLAAEDARLMIVCACPPDHPVLSELKNHCDALCWKAVKGFDFSAYAIGLTVLAQHASGSDVLVLNDSMLGPFSPLVPFMEQARWRLSGLSASALEENHLQSFAFIVRQLNADVLKAIAPVMSTKWCYDTSGPVILLQETLLARVANHHVSVGAFWYTDGSRYQDLCLNCPEQMLDAGFPLLKRSLFGKFASGFQDPSAMQALLRRLGHPEMLNASD
jgi:putative colanic acid biosynthesis UDP-glucose lipid carrier transferase